MHFKGLLKNKYQILLISSYSIGLIGILSLLFDLHRLFIALIIVILVLQLFLVIKDKRFRLGTAQQILIDEIPLPIIITMKGKIHHLNLAAVQLIGVVDKKEVFNRSIFEFLTSTEREDLSLADIDKEHTVLSRKLKFNCLNDRKLDIELLKYRLQTDDKAGKECYVIMDISSIMESEKKLQHSEQLSVVGELAAGVAHEIRNPLTSLKGFLQLSASSVQNAKIYHDIMLSEINRINLIVGELLLLAKPKEMVFQQTQLLPLIGTVVTIVKTQAILYNIEIRTEMDQDVKDIKINCEENKLKQVFINILKNGIEAMEKEGEITIKINKQNEYIHITFIDQGKGIPEEELQKIGKRFYTTKENGTGLGLMISFNIIEHHNGKMNISSEVGKGTEIEIILPIHQ